MESVLSEGEEVGSLIGARLAIVYVDANGERSQRLVRATKVFRRGELYYLQAHCELRSATRTFRLDRIVEVIDTRSGEVFDDPESCLKPLLLVARARSPNRKRRSPTDAIIAESEHGLAVLLYFAQTDEKLRRGERAILWRYLDWQQERCSIAGRVPRRPLNAWMDSLIPDTEQFASSLNQLLESEAVHARYVLARIPEIVMADGRADEREKRRLRELLELLGQAAAD